jgi:DNA repair exonuclease SbcCD ATPase subunit
MEISLTNFKCHKKKEIKIDKSGLILLDGASGKGKSSIFEAINFCLYNTGKKLIHHNTKKMSVEIKFYDLGIQIIRSKGPNRLILINKDGEHEDNVAQGIINEIFSEYFLLTSYITQDNNESFLKLSASDKMEFLEKQAFGTEVNIDELKRITKEEIKIKKLEVQKATNTLEIHQKELDQLEEPDYKPFPLKGKLEEQELKIKEFNKTIEKIKNDINVNNKELNKLKRDYEIILLEEKRYNQYIQDKEKYESELNDIKEKIVKLTTCGSGENIEENLKFLQGKIEYLKNKELYNSKKTKYQEDIKYYKELHTKETEEQKSRKEKCQQEYNELKIIVDKYSNVNEIKKEKKNIELKKQDLTNKISNFKKYDELISKIPDKNFIKYKELYEEKKKQIQLLNNSIEVLKSRLSFIPCPHCSNSLRLYKETITKADGIVVSKEEKEKMNSNKQDVKKLESEIMIMEKIIKQIDIFGNVEKLDLNKLQVELDQYEKELTKFENEISEINTNTYKLSVLFKKLNDTQELSKTLLDMKNKLLQDKKTIDKLKVDKEEEIDEDDTIDNLREQITKLSEDKNKYKILNEQLSFTENKLNKINKDINSSKICDKDKIEQELKNKELEEKELKEKQKRVSETEKQLKLYNEYKKLRDEFEKWKLKVDEDKIIEEEKSKELALINKYWSKILESESMAILGIIQTINHNVNMYLDKFFEENSINVSLSSFKENKKCIKPGINVNVFYKGESCDLNSLSGGERSRVNLAFLLSLNSLTNSKIVLLDECISSLDSDLCDDILEILRDQNKLILVIAHQVNTGSFAQIINV